MYVSTIYKHCKLFFKTIPPIWFKVNIDYTPKCQILLVYPVAKFNKTGTEA